MRFGHPDPTSNSNARRIVWSLSKRMLAVLVEHGGGAQPIIAGAAHTNTVLSLRNRKLLKVHAAALRPRETMATTLGRQVIAAALAIEADRLTVVQGFADEALSLEAVLTAAVGAKRAEPIR